MLLGQLYRLPKQEQPVFHNNRKQQQQKKTALRPEFVPWEKKLISMNALKIHNQMKILKRGWWKEINQVVQISKIARVIQLAVNYCIRKAVGTLRYTVSVSTGAGMWTCLSRSRHLWLSRSADNNAERFDHLSRETYTKHSDGAKAFWPPIVVARTP